MVARSARHARARLRGRTLQPPASLITDNGPEFAGLAVERWSHVRQVTHRIITRGKPSQNGYIESFNGKLRDEVSPAGLNTATSGWVKCSHLEEVRRS